MSHGDELKSKGAKALRAAGFRPLPRWWVRVDELDAIERIVEKHRAEVNKIRAIANGKEAPYAEDD